MKGKRTAINAAILALAPILLVLAGGVFEAVHATGQQESSCDFVTGGGQVLTSGGRANFGVAGGVQRGAFWGHLHHQDKANDLKVEDRYIHGLLRHGPAHARDRGDGPNQ